MKATHNKASEGKVEWKFPCVGIDKDGMEVVGFCEEGVGVVLANPRLSRKLLEPFGAWNMDEFTPLPSTESVTLQND
jgi:hypothetical protein